jgi:hypothetical protein
MHKDNEESLQLLYEIPIEGASVDNPLTEGYFMSIGAAILFINGDFAFRIESSTLTKLSGYHPTDNFESVDYIVEYDIITVAEGPDGVRIYNYDYKNNNLIELGVLDSSFFRTKKIDISDVGIYINDLYVLDMLNGIYKVSVYKNNITASLTSRIFNRTGCENMVIDVSTLYVTCPEINEIQLRISQRRTYPDALFHVKNMIVANSMVVITGDNLIKIYFNGKIVGFYEELRIDRIRMTKDYFNWTLSASKITCGLKSKGNEEIEGSLLTTINVVAKCTKLYFEKYNLPYTM